MKALTFDIIGLICEFALYGPKNYESTKAFIEAHNMTFEYIQMGEENNKMIKFMDSQEKQLMRGADKILQDYKIHQRKAFDTIVKGIDTFTHNKHINYRIETIQKHLNSDLQKIQIDYLINRSGGLYIINNQKFESYIK